MIGHTGKILKVNLTTREISTIDTSDYEEWYGGNGMGSAICWDLTDDWSISGFDPKSVMAIMPSPLSGTLAPSVAGRTEVVGLSVQAYPFEWFSRANFGGRFAGMLKYAGWDGIVIQGAADSPVWLDIRNGDVELGDASRFWGLDTWEAQKEIMQEVSDGATFRDWWQVGQGRDSGRSTQRPAVLAIGPAGENQSRTAALVHGAGSGAGQCGFGGVWGSKMLKAISVIGTGSVEIANPSALMEARLWAKNTYGFRLDDLMQAPGLYAFGSNPGPAQARLPGEASRPYGCLGCHRACHGGRSASGQGNESHCVDGYYAVYDQALHGEATAASAVATDLMQKLGINCWELSANLMWLSALAQEGLVGPGLEIDTNLRLDKLGSAEFIEDFLKRIAYREEIGDDLAEGCARCAAKWGRLEEDTASGILPLQEWGYPHHYDARTEAEWGWGSLFGARDINEHDFNWICYWSTTLPLLMGQEPLLPPDELAKVFAEKLVPYNDPMMIDYSDEGIYSDAMAKTVAWHRHYTRFWKQSIGYCDWAYADFVNQYGPDYRGLTPEAEPKFLNAVTGGNLTFEEGLEIGRKIWNLHRSMWTLQGRHRDIENYSEYNYTQPGVPGFTTFEAPYTMPVYEDGQWQYKSVAGRMLDKDKTEEFKTKFYALEGWDTSTGWPTRATLEELGLGHVADKLEANGKLGV